MSIDELKEGSYVKVLRNLPIEDPDFVARTPGWVHEYMDRTLGQWLRVESIDVDLSLILLHIESKKISVYFSSDWIDWNANPIYRDEKMEIPKNGDWVVYFESDDDREIASVGKVTNVPGEDLIFEIDNCGGFTNVYKFNGDVSLIERVRNGEI